ncbi:MAG: hypothetical protein AAF560_16995 [Acidobacteriota bacterium]
MTPKSILHRTRAAQPVLWAAFEFADVAEEAMRRTLGTTVNGPTATDSFFVGIGQAIQLLLDSMIEADVRYQNLKLRQRRIRRQRDHVAQRLYGELRDGRRLLEGMLGRETARDLIGDIGETQRDPFPLLYQAEDVALRLIESEYQPENELARGAIEAVASTLEASARELDEALDEVIGGRTETTAAMLDQRRAMKDFDRTCKNGAILLEEQLFMAGLPSLADLVRPGVRRRGRPPKQRPKDRYPDLILKLATATQDRARSLEDGSTPKGKIKQPFHECQDGARKIEQPFHELSEGEEKIEQPFRECQDGTRKIEQPFHEPSEGEEKIEQPFHGSLERHLNTTKTRLAPDSKATTSSELGFLRRTAGALWQRWSSPD